MRYRDSANMRFCDSAIIALMAINLNCQVAIIEMRGDTTTRTYWIAKAYLFDTNQKLTLHLLNQRDMNGYRPESPFDANEQIVYLNKDGAFRMGTLWLCMKGAIGMFGKTCNLQFG